MWPFKEKIKTTDEQLAHHLRVAIQHLNEVISECQKSGLGISIEYRPEGGSILNFDRLKVNWIARNTSTNL